MRFWDSSAIVPLVVDQPATTAVRALATRDSEMLVWWGSRVECVSALARLERQAALEREDAALAYDRLRRLVRAWHEVEPGEIVRETAMRFLRVHPLRAADALQLAAAFVAAGQRPAALEVVTLDERLADAAAKEGFVLTAVAGR